MFYVEFHAQNSDDATFLVERALELDLIPIVVRTQISGLLQVNMSFATQSEFEGFVQDYITF